jgi:uncharacterized protein (DUF1330 family)
VQVRLVAQVFVRPVWAIGDRTDKMITCYLRYVIDPHKIELFEAYARKWLPLVERFGGQHHGYFLPHEGASNVAVALFSFPSLAAYEEYRSRSQRDPECCEAYEFERKNRSILSYERTFMRPVFPELGAVRQEGPA